MDSNAPRSSDQAINQYAPIEQYLQGLDTQRKLSKHTLAAYRRDLIELSALAASARLTLAEVTHFHVRKFAAQLHAGGLSPRSIARRLSAWRGFYGWLSERSGVMVNVVDGVRAPKLIRPLPKALPADEAVRLVSRTTPGKNPLSTLQLCNRAMFELLYSSGLRVSELVELDLRPTAQGGHAAAGWIDFELGDVTVTGKGNKMRCVPVGRQALQAIQDWLSVRATLVRDDPNALFISERGTRMSARAAQRRLKAHAQALGMPAKVHPHVLRHSFASHLLQSSGDLRAIQELLGHTSLAATQVYTSLDFQRLAQVYDAAHPRAKRK